MRVLGIDGLDYERLEWELERGGRFVFFEYCISLVLVSLRRPGAVWYLPPGHKGWDLRLIYSLPSVIFGWWGIPWGLVYTPLTLINNLGGGCDVTEQVRPRSREEWEQIRQTRRLER
jgi:hypothetical protein